jgi:CBS-domain-containing membrane protein
MNFQLTQANVAAVKSAIAGNNVSAVVGVQLIAVQNMIACMAGK